MSISKIFRSSHSFRRRISSHWTATAISSHCSLAEASETGGVLGENLETSPASDMNREWNVFDRRLENGVDIGIYKAILVGQVGQAPVRKRLKSGKTVTLFSLGTGGIRNNRRPLDNEEPQDYANRCSVQWHRVSIYSDRLGILALDHVTPGSILYVEGNIETKVFVDSMNGLVRRIREIALRKSGRLVFLGGGGGSAAD